MCMGRTHAISGAAAWLGVAAVVGTLPGPAIGGAIICAAGALVPDLDHPNSLIAHRLHIRPICRLVARLSGGHRHGTHSLLMVLGVWLAALWVHLPLWAAHAAGADVALCSYHLSPYVAAAFATGVGAHIAGDMLTPEGVPLLWPVIRHRFSLHLFTTNTWPEQLFVIACVVGGAIAARHIGIIPPGPYDHLLGGTT